MEISREPASFFVLVNVQDQKHYRLKKGLNFAGRYPCESVHVCLRAVVASRQHAELIVHEDDTVSVYDVGSGNGTYINGRLIQPYVPSPVSLYDEIGFGVGNTPINELPADQVKPMFELQMRPPTPPRPPPALDTDTSESEEEEDEDSNDQELGDCDMRNEDNLAVQDEASKNRYVSHPPTEATLMPPPPPPVSAPPSTPVTTIITPHTSASTETTNTVNNQSKPAPDTSLAIDYTRVKTEDCIIEIEDDEDEDMILSQAVFAPAVAQSIPDSMFFEMKRELDDMDLGTDRYLPIIDLTEERDDALDWLNDSEDFEAEVVNIVQGADLEDVADCDEDKERSSVPFEPIGVVDTVGEAVETKEVKESDSDSDVIVRRIKNKRRYSIISSDSSESENDRRLDSNSAEKYAIAPSTSKDSFPSSEKSLNVDKNDDELYFKPERKDPANCSFASKKLKPNTCYIESRTNRKSTRTEKKPQSYQEVSSDDLNDDGPQSKISPICVPSSAKSSNHVESRTSTKSIQLERKLQEEQESSDDEPQTKALPICDPSPKRLRSRSITLESRTSRKSTRIEKKPQNYQDVSSDDLTSDDGPQSKIPPICGPSSAKSSNHIESKTNTKSIQLEKNLPEQPHESSDDDFDNDEQKVLPTEGPAPKKLKPGSNYVESRMDMKGIQLELAKRHKMNKRKKKSIIRPVTNVDLLDKHTRENILKERKERLKNLSSVHVVEVEKKEEEAKPGTSKDDDKVHKAAAKVKVSNGRGSFLCAPINNVASAAARPPSKYKIPQVVEPHHMPTKVRIAHNGSKSTPITHPQTTLTAHASTSTESSLACNPHRHNVPHLSIHPTNTCLPPAPLFITPSSSSTINIHPTVACMINWPSRSFNDYHNNPRSGCVPGLGTNVAVERLPHTRTWYESYDQYKMVMQPLMEIEMWMTVYADWSRAGRTQDFFRAKIDHIDIRSNYTAITCKTFVNSRDAAKSMFRRNVLLIGSFQIIDPLNTQRRSFMQLVTYVHSLDKRSVYPKDDIPPGIIDGKADVVLSLTLLTKATSSTIDSQKLIKCDFLSYVSNSMRLFDAVEHLRLSPLKEFLLNPTLEQYDIRNCINYGTPMYTEVPLNESQRGAVLEVSHACARPEPSIRLIDGPPGTGKTTVITQILRQLLSQRESKEQERILVLAPSNGAIDNLMLKIIAIKKQFAKDKRYSFRIIRVGPPNQVHPEVIPYCIEDYASKSLNFTLCKDNPVYKEEYSHLCEQIKILRQQRDTDLDDPTISTALRAAIYKTDNFARSKLGHNFHRQLARERCTIINHCHIICSTLSSCFRLSKNGDLPLRERVTCCIVDEATQSVEQDTLIPLLLDVNKMILVGDPQQLPAITTSSVARTCGYGQSLFARMKLRLSEQALLRKQSLPELNHIVRFLDTQYRMHPHISLFPNYNFYSGRLKDAAHITPSPSPSIFSLYNSSHTSTPTPNTTPCYSSSMQQRPCPVGLRALRPYMVIRQSERDLYPSQQYGNLSEVELVVGLYREIANAVQEAGDVEKGAKLLTVGIITPYNKQKELIETGVKQLGVGIKDCLHLSVTTVDGVQGQEKDVVIISNVRMHGNAFVENENRLNVALTRAKHVLYIVGSDNLFENSRLFRDIERDAISRKLQATIPHSGFVRDVIRVSGLVS